MALKPKDTLNPKAKASYKLHEPLKPSKSSIANTRQPYRRNAAARQHTNGPSGIRCRNNDQGNTRDKIRHFTTKQSQISMSYGTNSKLKEKNKKRETHFADKLMHHEHRQPPPVGSSRGRQ